MQLFSCFLFAFSASLDALIVGITYGIRKVQIILWQNLLVSLITLTGTVMSLALGHTILPLLPVKAASLAGSVILILLGSYYLLKYSFSVLREVFAAAEEIPNEIQKASSEAPPVLSFRELFLMGAALSLNNVGIGIGASIAGLESVPTALFTLLFSVLFLSLGNRLGKLRILGVAERFADPLSGILLIGLGICELLS